ncbi:hypothetical protein [Commensalibacter papalotli (ex Botero et al. 2024)]|uniref:hypothetical protein n=1 Tax=Commensalibacter papalotli (ex Botero et al. 2024) TaxID=2972766 RepID=UPI0022FF9A4D|nr:hypothetical protein [Commensalibacter papalotli (ex Botero et al. 2024)]CAI3958283.1 unnamed protein product [Commensalibacter papalotli (ex Botero et al. 2024)]
MYKSNNIVTLPIDTKKKNSKKSNGDGGGDDMNERIVKLESNVERIKEKLVDINKDMDRRFDEVDKRFDAVDKKFDQVDKRFDKLDAKVDRLPTDAIIDLRIANLKLWIIGCAFAIPSFMVALIKFFNILH